MKKVLVWVLLLTLVLGSFAGCKNKQPEVTEPQATEPPVAVAGAADAIEYLKGFYKDDGTQTPVDYNRFGIVRVGGVAFDVVWTVDVGEDLIKIVVNEDGTVTIDINEECPEDTEYTLTATVTDAQGNTVSHSWTHILPKAQDMVEIVKAAYALKPGESLPYESRLIGKIITIDTIWSDEYQNIGVTIEVAGAEDMPIKCYRMKANDTTIDQIKGLLVGNIITVRGTLKNYEGTIEFDAGCILEKVEKGDAVEAPTDPGQILKEAYALADGKVLPYQATLTGTVTEIDTPYDPAYGNISVVIVVEDYPQYPILCYRLKGTGVDQIAVNDLITVTGIIKNYEGTIEYDAGCIMTERVSGGGVAQGPSSDAAKILADAAKLQPGEKLEYRATLTGTIYSVDTPYSSEYNNITVTMMVNGVRIQCYRMVGDGISLIQETDTITVSGVIENYNGKLEFSAKCNLDSWSKGPRNVNYGPLVEGVAYKLYIDQKGIDKILYFNGQVSGSRLSSTTNGAKGADVFAEKVSGKGLRLYYMDGSTKTYIEMEEYLNDKAQYRGSLKVTTTPSCYWVYDSYMGIYVVNLPNAGKYLMGTYSTYETFSASWIGYIDGTVASSSPQYVAKFIKSSDVSASEPADTVVQGTPVENPQVGTGYKFGFQQNQLDGKPFLGFAGKMAATYYFGTSETIDGMVDVYLEEADGGYYLYFKNGTKKTYLDIVPRDNDPTKVNVVMQTSGTHTVYQLNTEYHYVYATAAGSEWYLGTYGQSSSISASKTSYISDKSTIGVSQFCAWFSTVEEVEVEPTEPDVTEPVVTEPIPVVEAEIVKDPEAGTAYKMGMDKGDGKVLYFTGNTESASVTYRLETTEDASKAVDVYLEAADGGYRLYFMQDGVKTYIRVFHRTDGDPGYGKGSLEFVTSAPSEVFTYDETANTLIYDYDGNNAYYMGTYSTFTTVSVSNTSYITGNNAGNVDVSQFPVRFYTIGEIVEPQPTEPQPTTPVEPPVSGDGYTKVTSADQLTSGKYVMVVSTGYAPGVYDNKWLSAVQPVISGNTVTDTKGAEWTLTVNGNSVSITDANGVTIKPAGGNTNGVLDGEYDWSWTFNNGTFRFAGVDADTVILASNATTTGQYPGNHRFRGYKTTTVSGQAANYPCDFTLYKLGGEYVEPEVTEPQVTEPSVPGVDAAVVTNPEAGVAYKMGMDKQDGKVLYFTGNTESASVTYRLETTEDASNAVDVYLEAADGGYRLYFMKDGVKTYIRVFHRTDGDPGWGKGSLEFVTSAPSEVFIYDETANTLIYDYDGNNAYYMGTYSTFTTFSVSNTSYITGDKAGSVDVTQFPARFYTVGESTEPEPTEPEPTEPEPTEPAVEGGIVENPVVGTAYKLGMDKQDGKVLYFTGNTESASVTYRLETSDDASKAVDVYLEAADGGYRLYFMKDGVKTYIRVFHRTDGDPGWGKGSLEFVTSAPSEVFTYDETAKTLIYDYDGNNAYYMGTYSNFVTVSVSNTSYITGDKASTVDVSQFPVRFYTVGEGSEPEPTEPEATEPTTPSEPPVSGDGYTKVTSADQLTSGKYVMVVSTGYAPGVFDNKWLSAVQPVISGNTVTDTKGAEWTLTVNGSSVTFTDANGVAIKPAGGNTNGVLEGEYGWSWTFNNGTFRFAGVDTDTVILASNATTTGQYPGNHRFRGYKTSTVGSQAANYPCDFTLYKLGGEYVEPEVTEPEVTEPSNPSVSAGIVTSPEAGVAYKMGMDKKDGKVLYFTGNTESASVNYRLETTDDVSKAVDVYLESADGGYRLYFMKDGVKTYIRVYHRTDGDPGWGKGSLEFVTSAPSEVMIYDETANTLIYDYDGNNAYYMGTYGTFTTFSVSNTSYITGDKANSVDVSQYPARFYAVTEGEEPDGTEPEVTEPEATEPSAGSTEVTYTFSNYGVGTQYTTGETYELDANTSLYLVGGHMNNQLRLYDDDEGDAQAIFTCAKNIQSVVINAGHRAATLNVYASVDGEEWVLIEAVATEKITVVSDYPSYTVEIPAGYKYLRLDAVGAQIRIPYMIFKFEG